MEQYQIPASETRIEIKVKNSRFISSIGPAFSIFEAREFIKRIKSEFKDATHNVPAFIIGNGKTQVQHCNDDGEPFGTAGKPVLSILQGSGLGDVALVVTRYFGGTKLGKGGLVRAYSDATRSVLEVLPRAVRIPSHTIQIIHPYNYFDKIHRIIKDYGGKIINQEFTTNVTTTFIIDELKYNNLATEIQVIDDNISTMKIISTEDEIIPL